MGCCKKNNCAKEDETAKKNECNWCTNEGKKCGLCGKYACSSHGKDVVAIWTCKACQ
jgi:hypothetical protein